jgi:hypothetical protein
MANRDLLKEAIADAKAVKETAIANAKAALEEAFGSRMKEMLSTKLAEMDAMDDEAEEMDKMKEKEVEETYNIGEADYMKEEELDEYGDEHSMSTKDALKMKEAEKMDEMDLDELLKELDSLDEAETINLTDFPDGATEHGNIAEEDDMTVSSDEEIKVSDDEEIDLENMSEDDLKTFIEDVIADMVSAGELEAGDAAEGDEEKKDEEVTMTSDEDISMDELMYEIKKAKKEKAEKEEKKEMEEMKKKLDEAYSVIETIKSELSEVNLFNAKLLYTNKIFKAKNLTESQKVKVLAAFDKAASVKEAKLVYETLSEGFTEKKSNINESVLRGSASKPAGVAEKKPILEVNDQFARWQKLAGIK